MWLLDRLRSEPAPVEVGKLADFILIDRDYMTTEDIGGTQVLKTFVGGKMVYERKE